MDVPPRGCKACLRGECARGPSCSLPRERAPVEKPAPRQLLAAGSAAERLQIERALELDSLAKRYGANLTVEPSPGGATTLLISHPITDPDFPYDLPSLLLECTISDSGYPEHEAPAVRCLNTEIPSLLRAGIDEHLASTASSLRGTVCIKRLVDSASRNLESLLAARRPAAAEAAPSRHGAVETEVERSGTGHSPDGLPPGEQPAPRLATIANPRCRASPAAMTAGFTQQSWHVLCPVSSLRGISTALLLSAGILLRCGRCSAQTLLADVAAGTLHSENCPKCGRLLAAQFFAGKTAPALRTSRLSAPGLHRSLIPAAEGSGGASVALRLHPPGRVLGVSGGLCP